MSVIDNNDQVKVMNTKDIVKLFEESDNTYIAACDIPSSYDAVPAIRRSKSQTSVPNRVRVQPKAPSEVPHRPRNTARSTSRGRSPVRSNDDTVVILSSSDSDDREIHHKIDTQQDIDRTRASLPKPKHNAVRVVPIIPSAKRVTEPTRSTYPKVAPSVNIDAKIKELETREANLREREERLNSPPGVTVVPIEQKITVIRPDENGRSHKRSRRSRKDKKSERIPRGHVLVVTDYGDFIIPDYDNMSQVEKDRERETLVARFRVLNDSYKRIKFADPREDEDLTNLKVRYMQSVGYVKKSNGTDITKMIMVASWALIQYLANKFDLDAEDYFVCQLQMYDVYETKMVELGEVHGIGEDWPAWVQIGVISAINLIIVVMMNSYMKNSSIKKVDAMRMISTMINNKGSSPEGGAAPQSGMMGNLINMATTMFAGKSTQAGTTTPTQAVPVAAGKRQRRSAGVNGPTV